MNAARLIAVSALMVAAPFAQAQDPAPYIGGGLGRSQISFDGGSFSSNSANVSDSRKTGRTGGTLFMGVDLNRHWAVEGGYTHFGTFKYNYTGTGTIPNTSTGQATYSGTSLWLAGKGTIPVSDKFDLYGKLGLSENRAKDTASTNDPALDAILATPYTRNGNKAGLLAGIGGEYHVSPKLGVRMEYDNYGKFGSSGTQNLAHLGMWTADVAYHF